MISFPLVDTAVLLIDYNSVLLWLLGGEICVSHQNTTLTLKSLFPFPFYPLLYRNGYGISLLGGGCH